VDDRSPHLTPPVATDFTPLRTAVMVKVRGPDAASRMDPATTTKVIDDLGRVQQFVGFAERHAAGWSTPWYGTPVAVVVLDFYGADGFKGHLGIGPGFLTTQRAGAFLSRALTAEDQAEILSIISLPGVAP
jgi:hypothetical protein